jgi:hypothetical protein
LFLKKRDHETAHYLVFKDQVDNNITDLAYFVKNKLGYQKNDNITYFLEFAKKKISKSDFFSFLKEPLTQGKMLIYAILKKCQTKN